MTYITSISHFPLNDRKIPDPAIRFRGFSWSNYSGRYRHSKNRVYYSTVQSVQADKSARGELRFGITAIYMGSKN